jgi:ATP-binding cassette subfamily B protein
MSISWILVTKFAGPAQARANEGSDRFNANLSDGIVGLATAKSFAQEDHEIARMRDVIAHFTLLGMRSYFSQNIASLVQRILIVGMLAVLLMGGALYLFHGKATVESIAYLALASTILQNYVGSFGDFVRRMLTASYDLHGVINLMREPEDVADPADAVPLDVTEGAITFDNVTFTYPGKQTPVFEGLSLTIRAGERIAVVGHSGGGKTSFVRLLQRLYDVQSGRILIDGQDIAHGTQRSLRQAIALVPQDPILFHRSLRDNIAYGKPDASLEDVRRAAEQAHIDAFIMGLPEQYETLVGERGIKLSGGERQRVAMARAILADRPILILDEATSSLDSASERAIQDALKSLTHGRTSIMIAHRLSTILDADRIVVFEKGKIVEEGTHEELAARPDGIYAGFFRMQSGGYIGED